MRVAARIEGAHVPVTLHGRCALERVTESCRAEIERSGTCALGSVVLREPVVDINHGGAVPRRGRRGDDGGGRGGGGGGVPRRGVIGNTHATY